MSGFDAIFLHKVMDYSRGCPPTPEIPDWKDLQKRLSEIEREVIGEDNRDVISDIRNLASDFDFDDELEGYLDKAYEKIDFLHRGIRDACDSLGKVWDPCNMTRDEMVSFVCDLQQGLEEYLPESVSMRGISMSWFGYEVGKFIKEHPDLENALLSYYTTDDQYHSTLHDDKQGTLNIKAGQNGVLTLETRWRPGKLIFTGDRRIVVTDGSPTGQAFSMHIAEFMGNFENWAKPTEQEIALFDVVHPGADWTVLRYLRDYQEKNYVSNKAKSGIDLRNTISVATTV